MKLIKSIFGAAALAASLGLSAPAQSAPLSFQLSWGSSPQSPHSYRHGQGYRADIYQAQRKLAQRGFRSISYVKPDKFGDHLFRAIDRRGRHVRLRVHNVTGDVVARIYEQKRSGPSRYRRTIPWNKVRYDFRHRGFTNIRLIGSNRSTYHARALNRGGERVQLSIVAATGELQRLHFVDRDAAYRQAAHESPPHHRAGQRNRRRR